MVYKKLSQNGISSNLWKDEKLLNDQMISKDIYKFLNPYILKTKSAKYIFGVLD